MAINTAIITTPEAAVKAQAKVKRKRSVAKALAKDGDITGARFELAEAADLDRAAAAILDPSNVLLMLPSSNERSDKSQNCRIASRRWSPNFTHENRGRASASLSGMAPKLKSTPASSN
jgi:hypothetical protein